MKRETKQQERQPYESEMHFRVSADQRQSFVRAAELSGYRTVSDWARAMLVTLAKKFEAKGDTQR